MAIDPQFNPVDQHFYTLFDTHEIDLSSQSSIIEVLKVGKIHDRGLTITPTMLEDYVANWQAGVYGTELQVNLSHEREGEAAGWIKDLFIEGDVLKAKVEWTPLGQDKVSTKQFRYISSELAPNYPDAKTGKKIKNVFIGCALTNVPAVKGMAPVSLSENLQLFHNFNSMTVIELSENMAKDHKALMAKDKLTKADMAEFTKNHGDNEGHDAMKAKLASKYAEQSKNEEDEDEEEKKPAAKGKKAAPADDDDDDDDEEESEKMSKHSEKVSTVSLSEFRKQQVELAEERKARISLQEKIERSELKEMVTEQFVLSESNPIGFKNDEETMAAVLNFAMSLGEDQRQTFFEEILPSVQHVDLSVHGGMGVKAQSRLTSEADIDKNADKITARAAVLLSEKKAKDISEAQKMAISEMKGD